MRHGLRQTRLARGAAEELLAQAEAVGEVGPWQEPTSLRQRWRDAGYAAAWAPGGTYWAAGQGAGQEAGGAEEGVFAGWASADTALLCGLDADDGITCHLWVLAGDPQSSALVRRAGWL